jgi:hypothetical protein
MSDTQEPVVKCKRRRGWFRFLCVVAVLALGLLTVRIAVAESFSVSTDAIAPEVPKGAHLIVYKLASSFDAGDIVAYREGDKTYLGRVVAVDVAAHQLTVARNAEPNQTVALDKIIGRGILNTR